MPRNSAQVAQQINDQMLVESAHSNPLLRPAVLNSKMPCCATLLVAMLDSEEVEINTRNSTFVDTGHFCINRETILSVRCVEIISQPLHTIVNVQLDDLTDMRQYMDTFLKLRTSTWLPF